MANIIVGKSTSSNSVVFYDPVTRFTYTPDLYKLDSNYLPTTVYPANIMYNGGLFYGLYRNFTDTAADPFPSWNTNYLYSLRHDNYNQRIFSIYPHPFFQLNHPLYAIYHWNWWRQVSKTQFWATWHPNSTSRLDPISYPLHTYRILSSHLAEFSIQNSIRRWWWILQVNRNAQPSHVTM